MLVKLAKVRSSQPLADAVDCAQTAGRKYIAAASHVLPHCRLAGEGATGPEATLPAVAAPSAGPAPTAALSGVKLRGAAG